MKYCLLDTKQHSIYRFCFKKCTCLRRDTSTHRVPFFIYRHVCCMPHRTCKTLFQRRCMPRCWLTKTPVYTPSERWKPVSVYLNFIGTIYWYGVTVFLKVLRNKRTTDVESTFCTYQVDRKQYIIYDEVFRCSKNSQFRPLWRGVLDTTLKCDKVCQWLAPGRWFSPSTSGFLHQ
jgi:hypothetical protein